MSRVKLTIEADGKTTQMECRSFIGMGFDPADNDADMIQFMIGNGDPRYMLVKAAEGMWNLTKRSIKDELGKNVTAAMEVEALKKAILGDSTFEEREVRRVL